MLLHILDYMYSKVRYHPGEGDCRGFATDCTNYQETVWQANKPLN